MEREMSTTVNITQFKNTMDYVLHLNEKTDLRLPVLLHGVHAQGKTEVVAQIAEKYEFNYVPLYLSTQDVSDLLGIPFREVKYLETECGREITEQRYLEILNDMENGLTVSKKSSTRFAPPDWLADALEDERPCIFFLDEMNRAPLYVLQTMLPFVLEGRLHTHTIRKKDIVIGAMNPCTPDYNVEAISDKALLSRFAHFYFEPEVSEWIQYAMFKGVHPSIIDVVNGADEIFGNVSIPDASRIKQIPDKRNMFKIGMMLNHTPEEYVKSMALFTMVSAMVGEDLAVTICEAFTTKSKLSPENIFDGTIFKAGIKYNNDLDKIKMINEALIGIMVNGEGSVWEVCEGSPTNFHNQQSDYAKFILSDKEIKNTRKWLGLCPKDAKVGFIKQFRGQLIERYKDDSEPNKGAFIAMALIVNIDPDIVDDVFPD
jgi:hypothetical protein